MSCGVCLVVIFLFSHFFYIFKNWGSSVREDCPFSVIYVFDYLFFYQHTLMDIYFLLCIIIQYYHYSFYFSNCSIFGHCDLLQVDSFVLLIYLHPLLSTSLFSVTTKWSRLILQFSCPSPEINHFSKEPRFLLLESGVLETKIWALIVLIATGVSLLQDSLSIQS